MIDYEQVEIAMMNALVVFMVSLAFVFIGVCIMIFCFSRSRTKKFLRQKTQEAYRKANSLYVASIVFTVLVTLFALSGIAGFFTVILELMDDPDPSMFVWNIVEIVEFALAVTAMALGITALTSFGKAKTEYIRISTPQSAYYGSPTVQNPQYTQYTYYQYPQQYGQQYRQQYGRPYVQQNVQQNSQQSYLQGSDQVYNKPDPPQPVPQSDIQHTFTAAPQRPAEKMCPSCGVMNEGKNQFCVFCGKPI